MWNIFVARMFVYSDLKCYTIGLRMNWIPETKIVTWLHPLIHWRSFSSPDSWLDRRRPPDRDWPYQLRSILQFGPRYFSSPLCQHYVSLSPEVLTRCSLSPPNQEGGCKVFWQVFFWRRHPTLAVYLWLRRPRLFHLQPVNIQ